MHNKRTRYVTTIFTLDKIDQSIGITIWDDEDLTDYLNAKEKNYGLKLISNKEEILIIIEYTNIIWNYRIYFGSYKKKYQPLLVDDERWIAIEKQLVADLKMIGLEQLKNEVLNYLINKNYFEYKAKEEIQFKQYCV